MKHIKLSLLLILGITLCGQSASAQNYRPFRAGMISSFKWKYELGCNSAQDTLEGLHTLNMEAPYLIGQDSIFEFNRITKDTTRLDTISFFDLEYIKLDQDNIFGRYMRERPGGIYEFITSQSDTFRIHTQDSISSTWVFNARQGITATLGGRSEMSFLDIRDSVLSIYLSTQDTIIISKNYGCIKTPYFIPLFFPKNIFPKDNHYFSCPNMLGNLTLWGIEKLNLGGRLPTFQDLFSIDQGDKFFYETTIHSTDYWQWRWITHLSPPNFPNSDSVIFHIVENHVGLWYLDRFNLINHDTVFRSLNSSIFYPNTLSHGNASNKKIVMYGPFFSKYLNNRLYYSFLQHDEYDSLTNEITTNPWHTLPLQRLYAEDLGRISSSGFWGYHPHGASVGSLELLVCYEKTNDSLGICIDPAPYTALAPILETANLKIFPNPASKQVTISWKNLPPGKLSIDVVDLLGKRMQGTSFVNAYQEKYRLDISALPAGIYVLKFLWEGKPAGALRLIIK